jgi:hypothetical protein
LIAGSNAPGGQIVLYLFGVAVFANYAWHIFNANEEDWREAKTDAKQKGEDDDFVQFILWLRGYVGADTFRQR